MMRELRLVRAGHLEWAEREAPVIEEPRDVVVRPFVAGRCDGDALPISRRASRALRLGMHLGLVDPIVGDVCGPVPFKGPYAIGHECVAEVIDVGPEITGLRRGDAVIVPWSVSCGSCVECARGLTAKCATTRAGALAAFGFGPASGPWGGMVADQLRIPFADHMLVRVPDGVDPLRVAAASDNLSEAWRCVIPPLRARPGGRVLILGGAAQSIGLYAAGLAACHGAEVDYVDDRVERLDIAEKLGATVHRAKKGRRRRSGPGLRRRGGGHRNGSRRGPRPEVAGARRHLPAGRFLPVARHEGSAHAHVRQRRHAQDRDLACPLGSARLAGFRCPQRLPG